MTQAYGYLRVSGKGQIEGDGFTRQREAIRRYAAAKGLRIVRWFEERGVSGTKELDDRPALAELMEALMENGVKTFIVEKLDRLARDLMVQETIIADLKKRGFRLESVAEPDVFDDSENPSRTMIRQIFGVIAQYEKAMIVLKLRGARKRKKAKEGRCEGKKPYGQHPDHPEEAEILERIRGLRDSGQSFDHIAEVLNKDGIPTRKGTAWIGATIAKILRRRATAPTKAQSSAL